MLDYLLFALTFIAALIIAIIWLFPSSKTVTTIPGLSPSTKKDGNLCDMAKIGSLHEFLTDLHSRFGPISGFWWGKTYVVSIASPELMKQHSNVFDKPPLLFKSFETLIGENSITFANGTAGRDLRRRYDPIFAYDTIDRYMCYFDECAQRTKSKWLSLGEDDHIALSQECFLYTINCSTLSVLGDYYKDEKIFKDLLENYKVVWSSMEHSILYPDETQDEEHVKLVEKAKALLRSSIKDAISYRKENDVYLRNNLMIDVIIAEGLDEVADQNDLITFLVGSFHTTGNLLTWALVYLATHRDVQDKLYKEVKSVIGEKGSVNKDNFSQFVYLIQVIDETLRCSRVAPWAARFQDFDSELGGHRIPKNTPVIHALGVSLQNEKVWPQPKKFDPERFSPENRKKLGTCSFVPFGFAGKRKCPAFRFAYWNAGVFLATIIQRFEVILCPDQEIIPVYGLVTHVKDEVWIKIAKR